MTIVRETEVLPGMVAPLVEITIELSGVNCEPLGGFYGDPTFSRALFGKRRLKPGHNIGLDGTWSLDLVGNMAINPPGTGYRITRVTSDGAQFVSCISVPVSGGPFDVQQLLIDPPDALPTSAPANLLDSAEVIVSSGALAVNAFLMTAVPNLIVSVPNVPYSTIIRGSGPLIHSVVSSPVGAIIAPVGATVGGRLATAFGVTSSTVGAPVSPIVEYRRPPNSPIDLQFFVYSFTAGTITMDSGVVQPGYLWVFST